MKCQPTLYICLALALVSAPAGAQTASERPLGTVHYFGFDGYDKDSNPDELEFNWNIDSRPRNIDWIPLTGPNRRAEYFFNPDEVGIRTIVIQSRDVDAELTSAPDTLRVRVVPASPRSGR